MALPWGGHRRSSVVGSGRRTRSLPERRRDPREDGASRARGEAGRRGSRAREDAGVRRRAADGAGGRGGRGRREEPAPGPTRARALAARGGAAQRPPRAAPGDARGPDRARDPARLGKGGRPPSLLEPRRTAEKALVAVIREAHPARGSRRGRWTASCAPWEAGASRGAGARTRSGVSRLRAEIDERVRAFLERRIEGRWPSLRLDATPALAGAGSASSSARTAASRAGPPWWPPR